MKKRYLLYASIFLLTFYGLSQFIFKAKAGHENHAHYLPTHYTYPKEELRALSSSQLICEDKLTKWEEALEAYFHTHKIGFSPQTRLFTYLYLAQRDAAFLSYNTHLCFVGSLDPISNKIITTFFPDFKAPFELVSDPYSDKLAQIIYAKYGARIDEEKNTPSTFQSNCTIRNKAHAVLEWIPWTKPLPTAFPPPPIQDRPFWESQLNELKSVQACLSVEQEEAAKFWRHHQWRHLSNEYMKEMNTPFAKRLLVRSILMIGAYDGLLAAFEGKYTYCIPRPHQFDHAFKSYIPAPNTPAHPSAHATLAYTAATILSHFFPCDCSYWDECAHACGCSRVWGGVHFPINVEAGKELGIEVGEATLNHPAAH